MKHEETWLESMELAIKSLIELYYEVPLEQLEKLTNLCLETFRYGGKIMICGNGGSHADAMHFAEEMTGRYRKDRKPWPVMVLGANPTHLTCVSNDYGFDKVFSREIDAFGREGDLLILLSTSGNSENLMNAYNRALWHGINTFALLGKDGGKLKKEALDHILVPGETSDRIQELHMLILHILVETIERELFPENYK